MPEFSLGTLLQVAFDLFVMGGLFALYLRSRRRQPDDPRLSRGLQLLQTKITVLEDLSDRTDAQVRQLSTLMDQKTRALQNKMIEAEQQLLKIEHSMNRSMEVAEIFQDKIPHEEIIERQRTALYVKAARLAHSGLSPHAIAEQVPLPVEQIELIAKFNRDQLMFDEHKLPAWADPKPSAPAWEDDFQVSSSLSVSKFEPPQIENEAQSTSATSQQISQSIQSISFVEPVSSRLNEDTFLPTPEEVKKSTPSVKKVVFPRID